MTDGIAPAQPPAAVCRLIRNEAALITWVDEGIVDVLGWHPTQLIGTPSTGLIHPDDQPGAVAAWFQMVMSPGSTKTWRGRYRAADGSWVWVESVNSNQLDDRENPGVVSVIRPIAEGQMSIEEELQARKQVLSRLTEALPVGVFQIDRDRRITFTNERLHEILGVPAADVVASQFAVLVAEDQPLFESALSRALDNGSVNDLELRFQVHVPHPEFPSVRVCQISLRPLTDGSGTVRGVIGCLTDVTDSVELRRELEIRAAVDGLTGCLNRTATFEFLDLALRQATSTAGLAVIFVDLDDFKSVNDRFGHAAGDRALVVAANRIRDAIRTGDTVGRLGGDEFVVVCPNMPTVEAALPVARRVSASLRAVIEGPDGDIEMGASVGLAWSNDPSSSPDSLIARADQAMYDAKLGRQGRVAVAT